MFSSSKSKDKKSKNEKKTPEKKPTNIKSAVSGSADKSKSDKKDKSTTGQGGSWSSVSHEGRDDKYARILSSLAADLLPSIRMKLRFEDEAIKLLKIAAKSTRLTALHLSGTGLVDSTMKEICSIVENSRLTYLGIHFHNFSSSALGGKSSCSNIFTVLCTNTIYFVRACQSSWKFCKACHFTD